MFFMARATEPTLPGLLGRSSTTPTREKGSMSGISDMPQKIPRYVEVAVPLPVRTLFTYRVPEAMPGSSQPGARAAVPVGRRIVTGVIAGAAMGTDLPREKIRDVTRLLDQAPVVPPDLLAAALWAARYYVAPP